MPRFKARFTVDGIERKANVTADNQTEAYGKLCSQAAVKLPNQNILVLEVRMENDGEVLFNSLFGRFTK